MQFSVERRSSIIESLIRKAEELDLDFRDDVILAESVPFFEVSDEILASAFSAEQDYEMIRDDLNNDYYDLITDEIVQNIGFEETDAADLIDRSIDALDECWKDIRRHSDDASEALADLLCAWLMDCQFNLEAESGQIMMKKAWDLITSE